MKRLDSLKSPWRTGLLLAAIIAAAACLVSVSAADSKPDKDAKPSKAAEKKKTKLTGAELYAIHCNRCHPERYPTEWNPAQWKTVMLHMRVRANLPASQAKAILKYLQEDAGN